MAPFIEALQNDRRELAALGDEQVAQAVHRYGRGLGQQLLLARRLWTRWLRTSDLLTGCLARGRRRAVAVGHALSVVGHAHPL